MFKLLTVFILSLLSFVANAGDAAKLNVLGFSADGKTFAFEQYGVQDGSGFLYAERFYINTSDDTFLSGTPIRVRLEEETSDFSAARQQAKSKAEAATNILDSALSMKNATIAASREITELNDDPFVMEFLPRAVFPMIDDALTVQLKEIQLKSSPLCQELDGDIGFELLLRAEAKGSAWTVLNKDTRIPKSRSCPQGYSLSKVITFYPETGKPLIAVLIAVRSFGFEGPDFRYIAVTSRLSEK